VRRTARNRDGSGGTTKTAPRVKDPQTQLALNTIYQELNLLKRSVNSSPNFMASSPEDGDDGDLR
jgi:hypothetical protein